MLETERDYPAAAGEYLNAIALAPALSPFYLDLGRVYYMKLNKYDDAITALRRATELDPRQPPVLYRARSLLLQQGRLRGSAQRPAARHQRRLQLRQCLRIPGLGLLLRPAPVRQSHTPVPEGSGTWRFTAGRAAEYYTELGWSYYFMGKCARRAPRLPRRRWTSWPASPMPTSWPRRGTASPPAPSSDSAPLRSP